MSEDHQSDLDIYHLGNMHVCANFRGKCCGTNQLCLHAANMVKNFQVHRARGHLVQPPHLTEEMLALYISANRLSFHVNFQCICCDNSALKVMFMV